MSNRKRSKSQAVEMHNDEAMMSDIPFAVVIPTDSGTEQTDHESTPTPTQQNYFTFKDSSSSTGRSKRPARKPRQAPPAPPAPPVQHPAPSATIVPPIVLDTIDLTQNPEEERCFTFEETSGIMEVFDPKGIVIAFRKIGGFGGQQLVVRHGPPRYCTYHIIAKSRFSWPWDRSTAQDLNQQQKISKSGEWQCQGVIAVAFVSGSGGAESIKPGVKRMPQTLVKVNWQHIKEATNVLQTWETRTHYRKFCGQPKEVVDRHLYYIATYQQEAAARYEEKSKIQTEIKIEEEENMSL